MKVEIRARQFGRQHFFVESLPEVGDELELDGVEENGSYRVVRVALPGNSLHPKVTLPTLFCERVG